MKARKLFSLLLCLLLAASLMLPAFGTEHGKDGVFATAFAEEGDGEKEGDTGGGTGGNTGGTGSGDTGTGTGGTGSGGTGTGTGTGGTGGGDTGGTGTGGTGSGDTGGTGTGGTGSGGTGSGEGGGDTGEDKPTEHKHTWEVSENKQPTCSEEGYVITKCKTCGETKKETLSKLAHTYDNACDPTCNVCGATRKTSHVPNKVWSKNAGGHWHICTVCGEKVEMGDHYPGPAATEDKDQICLTCGYVMTKALGHVHKYEATLSYDATGHWYACESCGDKKDFSEHVFDNPCDPDCNVCGYVSSSAHDYGDTFQYDEESHWGVCTLCGQEGDHLAHVPGDPATEDTPQVCTVCGKVLVQPLSHVHEGEEWIYDEETHTQTCSCGLVLEEGPHIWDEGTENPDGTVTYVCTQCGMERIEGEPKAAEAEFPWILVIGAIALVCAIGAGVTLVILLAKKPAGKYSK